MIIRPVLAFAGSFLTTAALLATPSAPPRILASFPPADVRLLDGVFRRAEELNRAYMLSLDPDRFLYHFRRNADLPTTTSPYGGWESSEWDFCGHMLGHYLSACSEMAAKGGEPEFRRRVDYIVAELAKCQEALANHASHPGFVDPLPEAVFDNLEQGKPQPGVPYYTMHKTLAGLVDAFVLAHNRQALDVATKLAAWMKFRLDRLSDAQIQAALRIEPGGINEAFANLYGITGNPDHLRIAERLNQRSFFDSFARDKDLLGPGPGPAGSRFIHANTQVPKAIGAAREYELTGNTSHRHVAVNFWRNVALTRSFIIGGNSETEHFYERGTDATHLTARTAEFCNTYNMLKLTRHLFTWAPSAELMDFYERALYNHVLAAQNPVDGTTAYFTSLEPGGRKRFATREHTFWCCSGTGMEMESKVADAIFFHDANSLYVNLFIASELTWHDRSLVVSQETKFPADDTTTLHFNLERPQRLVLRVRHPYWANSIGIAVNGVPVTVTSTPASYATLDREWHDGDRVTIHLPMTVRGVPLKDDPSLITFMYGPLVLAGDLGDEGLRFKPHAFVDNGKDPRGPRVPEAPQFVPGIVTTAEAAAGHVRRAEKDALEFQTSGIGRPRDVILRPLYQIGGGSYTVYWKLYDEPSWQRYWATEQPAVASQAASTARTVDAVWAGLPDSEAAHSPACSNAPIQSPRLTIYRDVTHGWLTWKLKSPGDQGAVLRVGFLGENDSAFDVFAGDTLVASQRPAAAAGSKTNPANATTIKTFPMPVAATKSHAIVELRIVGHPESGAARIVFCELLEGCSSSQPIENGAAGAAPSI